MKSLSHLKLFLFGLLFTGLVACNSDSGADTDTESEEEVASTEESTSTAVETTTFVSEDGNFSINFPGEPTESVQNVPTELGDIKMHMFMYEAGAQEAYMVAYSDYPASMVSLSEPMELLEGAKDGAINSLQTDNMVEEENTSLNDYPGLYFKANSTNASNTYHTTYKMYMVDNRLYQVAILCDGYFPEATQASNFFGSFKLNN